MYIRLVELPTCRANALDRASPHITYMAVELHFRTKKEGGVAHACARHGVCCMHVSFCMHFCRLQACAEAQVYLMQECHASVACNLHVHLYIWRLMRNMMRDHPQPVRRRVAKGRAFLSSTCPTNHHLAYALALFI